jgi:hypothetical protein
MGFPVDWFRLPGRHLLARLAHPVREYHRRARSGGETGQRQDQDHC